VPPHPSHPSSPHFLSADHRRDKVRLIGVITDEEHLSAAQLRVGVVAVRSPPLGLRVTRPLPEAGGEATIAHIKRSLSG